VWFLHFCRGGVNRSFGSRKRLDDEHESQHLRLERRWHAPVLKKNRALRLGEPTLLGVPILTCSMIKTKGAILLSTCIASTLESEAAQNLT
jgi:hypothetical protein